MSKAQVLKKIKKMKKYDMEALMKIGDKSGHSLMVLTWWYNATH